MEKDEFFLKRIRELANLSWQRDIVTFSDFLNLNEQNIVSSLKHQFPQIVMETSGLILYLIDTDRQGRRDMFAESG